MSSNSPCAACKFQRRKCTPECIFAPYFPPEDPQKFVNVHKVFGGSNVSKILSDLNPTQREEAAKSLAFEAECRLRDPIYGCVGYIAQLQQRLKQLHFDLTNAKEELATYIGPSALLPTFPQHAAYNDGQMMYNTNIPQQPLPQQQMMGNNPSSALPYTNLIGAPTVFYGTPGTSQQQQQQPQMMLGGGGGGIAAASSSASALPYTSLMPSVGSGGASQAALIREQQQQQVVQHVGVVEPQQQYGAVAVATNGDHGLGQQHELIRSYELQQQDYLVFKGNGDDHQYEVQTGGGGQVVAGASAAGGFIQMAAAAAAADEDEIGGGPSLALGVNYENNPYNNSCQIQQQQQDHDAQQHHIALQPPLLLQQHDHDPDQHVLQSSPPVLMQLRKAESDEGRSANPSC